MRSNECYNLICSCATLQYVAFAWSGLNTITYYRPNHKNYRNVAEIAKHFDKTGIIDYMRRYRDVIYDEASIETFHQNLEFIQYNACVALSGAVKGSPKKNFTKN